MDEKPELLFEVKDDEVPFEKYISAEEQAKLDEQAKLEEGLLLKTLSYWFACCKRDLL